MTGSLIWSLNPQWPLLDKDRSRRVSFIAKTKRFCDYFYSSEICTHRTPLTQAQACLQTHTHDIKAAMPGPVGSLLPRKHDHLKIGWLTGCPNWIPSIHSFVMSSYRRKKQAVKKQSLAHNPRPHPHYPTFFHFQSWLTLNSAQTPHQQSGPLCVPSE